MSDDATETVTIARLGHRGDGVTADGLLVPGALPGECVSIIRDGKYARLVALVSASKDRSAPICPHFGLCGGCAVQHLAPEPYTAWKRGIAAQALTQAHIEVDLEALVDAHGSGRRRITLHVRQIAGRARAGLMAARSHRLVPIDHCPITVPALHGAPAIAERLAGALGGGSKPLDVLVTATETGLDVDIRGHGPIGENARAALTKLAAELNLARLSNHGERIVEGKTPTLTIAEVRLVPPPGGFLQATAAGEAILTVLVKQAMPKGAKRVADLFAGFGPFTLALAKQAEVHAVEADEAALGALDRAMRQAQGLKRITTERRDLFRRPLLAAELDRFDAIVLDPPRAGAQAQMQRIAESKVATVISVSCDSGSFARDAAILIAGGYALEWASPVDQFKYSAHLEMVGVFRKEKPRRRLR